jgi:glycerol-3-phosphate dehydrogenase
VTLRSLSVAHRAADLADATSEEVDVLVVGAGATGAGVALDAASRGMTVVLVDKGDLASGTSSKSSKLIHGGLRYLENYEFGLVHESVAERDLLLRLAPHLVRPMDFIYPIFPDTARLRMVGLGLTTYDVLAGFRNVRRHARLTAEEAIAIAPALATSGLQRGYVYGDCATDDARLVLAVTQAAHRFGATVLTYSEVRGLLFAGEDGSRRVCGAVVHDRLGNSTVEIRARHVVNATGVWVDALLAMDEPTRRPAVQPSKGVHLVVPSARVPLDNASILLPSRQGDGRSMFAIPWGRQTILGTTDTAYDGPLDTVTVEQGDVDYILAASNALFQTELTQDDVVGAWAGNRPLLKGTDKSADGTEIDSMSDMSRRHTLLRSDSGLLTITGGKLTTFRRMAKDVVDRISRADGRRTRCRTDEITLGSRRAYADGLAEVVHAAEPLGLDAEVAEVLWRQLGDTAPAVLSLAHDEPALAEPLSPAAAHIAAEVVQAARHEAAATLDDVFSRRMRLSLRAKDAALPSAPAAARLLAKELGRDDAWAEEQVHSYEDAVRGERGALGLAASRPGSGLKT